MRARNSRSWLTITAGAAQPGDEPLEPLQPVEVEVVGGLVEQQHVVAGQQQRREPGARGLPAGQRRHRGVERDAEPDVGRDRARALVEVGAAEGEPAVQRGGVGVVRTRRAGASASAAASIACCAAATPVRRARNAATVSPGRRSGSCGRCPTVAVGGLTATAPSLGRRLPGEDPQQRGLARAVRPDQPDDVARGEHEVEAGEQDAGAVAGGEAGGLEGGAHLAARRYPGWKGARAG